MAAILFRVGIGIVFVLPRFIFPASLGPCSSHICEKDPMKYHPRNFIVCFIFLIIISNEALSEDSITEKQTANLLVISETAYAIAVSLHDGSDRQLNKYSWTAEHTEATWKLTINGESPNQRAIISIIGYLWSEGDGDWSVNFSGSGELGTIPILIHGRGVFIETKRSDGTVDYEEMRFSQLVKLGTNSSWQWIKGAEMIVGGVIGGAGGVIAAPATAGASLILGLGGAIGGAAATVSISNEIREIAQSDEPVPPPEEPKMPSKPKANEPIAPKENQVMIAVFVKEGRIIGAGNGGNIKIGGEFSIGKNTARGYIEIQ